MDRAHATLQHLSLPTAAAMVHIGVAGVPPDASKPARMSEVLNLAALALSNVASIYAQDSAAGKPQEIPAEELVGATILSSAHVLLTRTGRQYRNLTVQRRDLDAAIAVLRRTGFAARLAKTGLRLDA